MREAVLIWKGVESECLQTRSLSKGPPLVNNGISTIALPGARENKADSRATSGLAALCCSDDGASRKLAFFLPKRKTTTSVSSWMLQHQILAPAACRVRKFLDVLDGEGSFLVLSGNADVQDAFHRMGDSCVAFLILPNARGSSW